MSTELSLRQRAIKWRLAGKSIEWICDKLDRGSTWFRKWWHRFHQEGADGLRERSRAPKHSPRRLSEAMRATILALRDRLAARRGPQARYRLAGAPTLQHELASLGYQPLPSVRQIERVLQQGGRTNPPFRVQPDVQASSSYPRLAAQVSNHTHQFDLIGPRYLKGSRVRYYFLVYRDVFDPAVTVEFHRTPKTTTVVAFLVRVWQDLGLPHFLQLDNDVLFGNSGRWPGTLNRVIRLALRVGVQLLFIPEGEPFRNGAVEHFNGWLQDRLFAIRLHSPSQVRRELLVMRQVCWQEHVHPDLAGRTTAQVRHGLSLRRLPHNFKQHQQPLPIAAGKIIFIRRVRPSGRVTVLKVKLRIGKRWRGQYVKRVLRTRTRTVQVYHRNQLIKTIAYPLRG